MPVNITCPGCQNRGQLPDGIPPDAILTCRACGVRSPAWAVTTAAVASAPAADSMGVWVGTGTPPLPSRPAPPDLGTALDARVKELDAREAELTARRNRQAEELSAELDRAVAAERVDLARRAEALAHAERTLEQRRGTLCEAEDGVRRQLHEWQAEVERLRAENAGLTAELEELRGRLADAVERYTAAAEQAAGQAETIEKMMAAGQRLIRQRDDLRVQVQTADHTLATLRAAAEAQGVKLD